MAFSSELSVTNAKCRSCSSGLYYITSLALSKRFFLHLIRRQTARPRNIIAQQKLIYVFLSIRSRMIMQNSYPQLNLRIIILRMHVSFIRHLSLTVTIFFACFLQMKFARLKIPLHRQTGKRSEEIDLNLPTKYTSGLMITKARAR